MADADAGGDGDVSAADPGKASFKTPYDGPGFAGGIMIGLSYFLIILFFPLSLTYALKIVAEYERVVIFRLGRLLPCGALGPGLVFIIPCVDEVRVYDLRTVCSDIKPQKVLTKDCVNIDVDAVLYSRVFDLNKSICYIERPHRSIAIRAATKIRKALGDKTLSEIVHGRKKLGEKIEKSINRSIIHAGIKVERIEIKEIKLPKDMTRAMAVEAEAARQARAKLIFAEAEQKSSMALKEAADIMCTSPSAIQLRYLQTLHRISAKDNSTIVCPLPNELLEYFCK